MQWDLCDGLRTSARPFRGHGQLRLRRLIQLALLVQPLPQHPHEFRWVLLLFLPGFFLLLPHTSQVGSHRLSMRQVVGDGCI